MMIKKLLPLTCFALAACSDDTPESAATPQNPTLTSPQAPQEIANLSFNEHIQPILSASCYHCHGPDAGTRMPEEEPLRLDTEEGAFAVRKSGKPVIIKGDPDNSYLLQLMETDDPNTVMPPHPTKSPHGKIMKPEEIALVRQWIQQGAEYEDHWAFIPPKKATPPTPTKAEWARTPIDHFVAAKLERAGLTPNPDEEKARLLRRLSFDLTGLPPSPESTKAFLEDQRDFDTVYAEKVDQLLNTQAYAEHFTRHWLDVARYADTHGIHIDNYRSIWPYRDWVLNAFKQNMPFDQFTREQIAGDMFENATLEQKIASGFHRCLPTTGEGGAIAEEYQAIYAQDRVDTTAAAWLALTTGCAACHDHKFDPISTKENYQLTAFFRNTTMSALDRNNATHPPNLLIPVKQDRERYSQIDTEIHQAQKARDDYRKKHEATFQTWLKSESAVDNSEIAKANRLIKLPLTDRSLGITDTKGTTYTSKTPVEWVSSPDGDAIHFNKNNHINLGDVANFENNQSFSYGAWIKVPHALSAGIIARMDVADSHKGYDLWAENGRLAVHLIHAWPQNYLKVRTKSKVPENEWVHAFVTYDGSKKAQGVKIYLNGQEQKLDIQGNKLTESMKNKAPLLLGSRHDAQYFTNGQLHSFQIFDKKLSPDEVIAISINGRINQLRKSSKQSPKIVQQIRNYYFTHVDKKSQQLNAALAKLNEEKAAIEKRGTITLVMQEKANQKPTAQVLIRGQYAVKDEEILSPDTPAVLPPMSSSMPKNRIGLGMWLTDPANPLPARVTVNRYWYYLFGSGIVESTNDFGIMGSRPSHPKLLDWLAVDFVENGWDFHHLLRTIVTSSTYRQSAVLTPEKREKDPKNILLSRGPRYRLDAEQIRDLALHSSGLLADQWGGPSVKPYQPANIWESVAMKQSNTRHYKQDSGEKLYRRSLYTFWKRTAPHPSMEILNAPAREVSCVRRELTNTPLQAFVVMNDPQFVESSRQLAASALKESKDDTSTLQWIAHRLLNRPLNSTEIEIVNRTLVSTRANFKANPENAAKLIAVGESTAPKELAPDELATWTLIANQILNMDETLNK
ncbi:DUF1553 domain-containing protein [Rubritalea tangerina]|uniref:DUF1553 domain-containing protein n=1 Tax=Rubritalea tangerina TaxID=430798 RepID=A0ABW4ZB37_9BACT